MPGRGSGRNHGAGTTPLPSAPRLFRRPDRGLLGGVATGIAEHVGVPTRLVRVAFVVLAFGGGLGVALYGAYLIMVPSAPDTGRRRFPAWLEYAVAGTCGLVAVAVAATSLPQGGLV